MSGAWTGLGSASFDGTLTLPRIDRLATIREARDFNDEGNPYITFNNPANFDVKVNIEFAPLNLTRTLVLSASGYQTSPFTWQLTDAQRQQLREFCNDAEVCNAFYYIETYKDGTKIGESEENGFKKMYIVNANPTISVTCTEQNSKVASVVGTNKIVLNNASTLKATATVTTKKSATVKSVYIQDQLTSSPYSRNIKIATTGTKFKINATVVDSRKIQVDTTSAEYTVVDYRPVSINSYKFKRENPTSSKILLNADITYWNSTVNNVANTVTLSYSTDGKTYTTIPTSAYTINNTNHRITISNYEVPVTLDYKTQGTFYLKVADRYTEDGENEVVTRGVAVFEKGEHDVQVNGELYVADENRQNRKPIKPPVNTLNGNETDVAPTVKAVVDTINEIIESGSGLTGNWVKYDDGTMICYGALTGTTTLSDYWGQFKRTEEDIKVNFPVSFKSGTEPRVTANGTNASGIFTVLIGGTYATYFKFTGLKAKNNTGTSYEIYYQATGKWK